MTLAEVERAILSKKRREKEEDRKRASFDYTLADLIGRSVARLYNSSNSIPAINEAYPALFEAEEVEEKVQSKKDEISAARFKQFAVSFNRKRSGKEGKKE